MSFVRSSEWRLGKKLRRVQFFSLEWQPTPHDTHEKRCEYAGVIGMLAAEILSL